MQVQTIGLDLAKTVFQVHGVDAKGETVLRERLERSSMIKFFKKLDPCLIGMESCGTSHYWARELSKLGHQVKLIPPQYVKPYVKRSKTDAADAEAICEAVSRPNMRFVPVKTKAVQAIGLLHRARAQLVGQRTALINYVRSALAEFGIVTSRGRTGTSSLMSRATIRKKEVPTVARAAMEAVALAIRACDIQLLALNRQLAEVAKTDDTCVRLATIPGVGPISASAIVATVGDASRFSSGRQFAAWIGLTPRQRSSGNAIRLGHISKAGDKTLRRLLVFSAFALIRYAKANPKKASLWLRALLERRPTRVVAVALANKAARIAWALMVHGGTYRLTPGV